MKKRKNRRAQTPKGRNLPTSGYGLHEGTLKDVEDRPGNWRKDLDPDEIDNWEEYVL